MTTEQKRQKIREKINEANPQLLKLEFGCEVSVKDVFDGEGGFFDIDEGIVVGSGFYAGQYEVIYDCLSDDEKIGKVELEGEKMTVLGKPPTLEHLLRTIQQETILYAMDTNGEFLNMDNSLSDRYYSTHVKYDLTKSPLEQSEEVTDFLYQIICE